MCIHLLQMQQDVLDKSSASISAKLAKAGYGLGQRCKIPRVTGIEGIHNLMQTLSTNCTRLSQKRSLGHGTGYWMPPVITLSFAFSLSDISAFSFLLPHASWDNFLRIVVVPKSLSQYQLWGGGYPNKGKHPLYKSVCMCIGIYHSYIFDYWNGRKDYIYMYIPF